MPPPEFPDAWTGPTDPDVDLSLPQQRQELLGHHLAVLGVIALGGVIGSLARYQIGRWWPAPTDGFPAATALINLLGALVIGVFMVLITEVNVPHRLVRPFFGTGVLGGFTTFSTYAIDIRMLISHDRAATAIAYLAITAVGAIVAVGIGMFVTRWIHRRFGLGHRSPAGV